MPFPLDKSCTPPRFQFSEPFAQCQGISISYPLNQKHIYSPVAFSHLAELAHWEQAAFL